MSLMGIKVIYIRLNHGFVYLVAIMDWATRAALSFRISKTIDQFFCIEAWEEAFRHYGKPPTKIYTSRCEGERVAQ